MVLKRTKPLYDNQYYCLNIESAHSFKCSGMCYKYWSQYVGHNNKDQRLELKKETKLPVSTFQHV